MNTANTGTTSHGPTSTSTGSVSLQKYNFSSLVTNDRLLQVAIPATQLTIILNRLDGKVP